MNKPRNLVAGVVPLDRCLAAMSSYLRMASRRVASTDVRFSSAALWMAATWFLIFSAYSAFFFSSFSCSHRRQRMPISH